MILVSYSGRYLCQAGCILQIEVHSADRVAFCRSRRHKPGSWRQQARPHEPQDDRIWCSALCRQSIREGGARAESIKVSCSLDPCESFTMPLTPTYSGITPPGAG